MATEKRLIEIPDDGIIRIPIMQGDSSVGERIIDLSHLPTVDAVEVVRCKDCKHYMTIHCTCDGCCISDDWYCADGERRTDNAQLNSSEAT